MIRFTCGDFEPLAGIVINPPAEVDDVDRDIKIDQHLGEFGVRLSKKDMLSRYGRTEATDDGDAAVRQQAGVQGFGGLANEKQPEKSKSEVDVEQRKKDPTVRLEPSTSAILAAFAEDMSPAGKAVAELLKDPSKEAAEKLLAKLDTLLPEDPATAAIIAEAMAKEFGTVEVANEVQRVPGGNGNGGQFTGKTNQPDGQTPQNDGKIDFKGNFKAKAKADAQSQSLGYKGIDDLMEKSVSVPKERVNAIVDDGDFTCEPHEAVAALRTLSVIKSNVKDGEVKLSERALRHYVCGERRHNGGEPEISRLKSLPKAIDAVKHSDSRHWELDDKPVVVMPGEQPARGTQAVYCKNQGKTKTYAYADSGVLNGWQVN